MANDAFRGFRLGPGQTGGSGLRVAMGARGEFVEFAGITAERPHFSISESGNGGLSPFFILHAARMGVLDSNENDRLS
jgi:hypothetical protein